MQKPKVLIFARREEPPEIIKSLEGAGYELAYGDRAWQLPRAATNTLSEMRNRERLTGREGR